MKPSSLTSPRDVVILYYNGPNDDDADTRKCVKGIEESCIRLGHRVSVIEVTPGNWRSAVNTPGDIFFNLVEDNLWKLYIKVGRRLEKLGRAQIGHDLSSFARVADKAKIKRQMKKYRISTPKFKIYTTKTKLTNTLPFPIIVKPSLQHAGIGISQNSVVQDEAALIKQIKYIHAEYPGEIVAEQFIPGREIHATVIGNGKSAYVFPLCEIGFGGKFKDNWNVYTYKSKWDKHSWEYRDASVHAPAKISKKLKEKIETLAKKAHNAFGCRDISRMDIRVDEHDVPYLVDMNMNPSLNFYDIEDATLISVYALKWTYDQFINTLITTTYKRVHSKK